MTMHVKTGGTWQPVNGLYVKVGGTWQPAKNGYVKVGGTWRPFYSTLSPPASAGDFSVWPSDAYFDLSSNGTWASGQSGGTWTTGSASSYSCRAINQTGDTGDVSGSGFGTTWLSLGTSRGWSISTTQFGGYRTCSFTVQYALSSDTSTVLAATSVTISVESLA